jgi:hypothetical protein
VSKPHNNVSRKDSPMSHSPNHDKIHIWSNGDPSVGINGCSATVEIAGLKDLCSDDPEEQEAFLLHVKKTLSESFQSIFDEKVNIAFDSELHQQVAPLDNTGIYVVKNIGNGRICSSGVTTNTLVFLDREWANEFKNRMQHGSKNKYEVVKFEKLSEIKKPEIALNWQNVDPRSYTSELHPDAILEAYANLPDSKAKYFFCISKDQNDQYVGIHGGIKIPPTKELATTMCELSKWLVGQIKIEQDLRSQAVHKKTESIQR